MLKKLVISLFLLPLLLLGKEFSIDPAQAVIRIADKTLLNEAKELQLNLFKLTGKKIDITMKSSLPDGVFTFEVGKVPAGSATTFKPEEAIWKKDGNAIYFYGDARNGVRHAIFLFLEKELGIRWPAPGVILTTPVKEITLKNDSGKWNPQLGMRVLRRFSKVTDDSAMWRKRMRMGSHAGIPNGHRFTDYWNRFGKTNPEFFALNSYGKRAPVALKPRKTDDAIANVTSGNPKKIKMCVTSEGLHKQIIADWQKKGGKYINISENDYTPYEYCGCENCRKLDPLPVKLGNTRYDFLTDRYLYFAHAVSKLALAKDPEAKVTFYAYGPYLEPPMREKVAKNFVLGIVPNDPDSTKVFPLIAGWRKAGMTRFYWRPNQHHLYNTGILPCGFEKYFFEQQKYIINSGSVGFMYDNPEAEHISLYFADYVLMRGMTNPEESYEDILRHYCSGFGAAAQEIEQYYEYWRKNWEECITPQLPKVLERGRFKNFARGLMWGEAVNCFKDSDFDNTDKMLDAALAKTLPPDTRNFISQLKVANTEARLVVQILRNKTQENSKKLYNLRKKHNLPLLSYGDQKWGDPCGIKNLEQFGEFDPPYRKMPPVWSFAIDPDDAGVKNKWYTLQPVKLRKLGGLLKINMNWENAIPRKGTPAELCKKLKNYDGIAWYATSFQIPADWKEREIYLLFEAVDESCQVFVNGQKAGEHLFVNSNDWQKPFAIRIDQCIKHWNPGHHHYVSVRVEDKGGNGGIWKNVHLVSKIGNVPNFVKR